jgi:hypothetical protein
LPEPDLPWMDRRALRPAVLAGWNANGCGPLFCCWVAGRPVRTGGGSWDMITIPSGS